MLVAISGSQGCGKSTLIRKFEEAGYNVIDRKTSRSILSDWGVSLEEVNTNFDLTIRFQDEILKRKCDDEYAASVSSDVWFTERTPIDLLVYSTVTLGMTNKFSDWLDVYGNKCIAAANRLYSQVIFLPAGHFSVEHDGVRGHNKHYSMLVDAAMERFYAQWVSPELLNVVNTPTLGDRINIINGILSGSHDSKKHNRSIYSKSATVAWK